MNDFSFAPYIVSVLLSAAGAWLISAHGHRFNLLDRPNERSSHSSATPKGGGIGILAGFISTALLLRTPVYFWLPAALLSVISFAGDRYHLSPAVRLICQFTAGLVLMLGLWSGHPLSSAGYLLIIPVSVFIVGTTNYYNFMDGINGMAAISGFIAFGLLAAFALTRGMDAGIKMLSMSLSLGCLAFLPFNFPQARVFMGDVGSILLGFVFSAFVFLLADSLAAFISLAMFLFPFYADEITTELLRIRDGEKLWTPHRRHLYQILVNEGRIAHWKVSLGYGLAQLIVGASFLLFLNDGIVAVMLIFLLYFAVFSMISLTVRRRLQHKFDS